MLTSCYGITNEFIGVQILKQDIVAVANCEGFVLYTTGIPLEDKKFDVRAPEGGTYTISSSKLEIFKGKIIDIPISRVYLDEFVEPDVTNPETKVDPAFRHMLGLNEE
jgi:hypothetical protein